MGPTPGAAGCGCCARSSPRADAAAQLSVAGAAPRARAWQTALSLLIAAEVF